MRATEKPISMRIMRCHFTRYQGWRCRYIRLKDEKIEVRGVFEIQNGFIYRKYFSRGVSSGQWNVSQYHAREISFLYLIVLTTFCYGSARYQLLENKIDWQISASRDKFGLCMDIRIAAVQNYTFVTVSIMCKVVETKSSPLRPVSY